MITPAVGGLAQRIKPWRAVAISALAAAALVRPAAMQAQTSIFNTFYVSTLATNLAYSINGGTSFVFNWPADHTGWRLQVQTNSLANGLRTNWAAVPASSATNQVTVKIVATNPVVIFRLIYP